MVSVAKTEKKFSSSWSRIQFLALTLEFLIKRFYVYSARQSKTRKHQRNISNPDTKIYQNALSSFFLYLFCVPWKMRRALRKRKFCLSFLHVSEEFSLGIYQSPYPRSQKECVYEYSYMSYDNFLRLFQFLDLTILLRFVICKLNELSLQLCSSRWL